MMAKGDLFYLRTVPRPDGLSEAEWERQWQVLEAIRRAREALDPEPIVALLDAAAVYESQSTLEPLEGEDAVADYLRKRFAFFRSLQGTRDLGRFIPATVDLPQGAAHPCLIFEAEGERQALWTVRLTATGAIARIDILTVAPPPAAAIPLPEAPAPPSA